MPDTDLSARATEQRATSPADRGTTGRGTTDPATSAAGVDFTVDLGGQWDENGDYWHYEAETGNTWVWQGSAGRWDLLATPEQDIRVSGRAQISEADRAAIARNDAYRHHLKGPARQYARDYGVAGMPTLLTAKLAGHAAENVPEALWPLSAGPASGNLRRNYEQLKEVEAEIAAEQDQRDMLAEAQIAHEHGELFQLSVVIATEEKGDGDDPSGMVAAGITDPKPPRVPTRVQGFLKAVERVYQQEIAKAHAQYPNARPSHIGMVAEKATLARAEALAKANGLNPGHIQIGNFPVGVTGPKGGALSAEMGSRHYGFIVELKKSPKAMSGRGHQTQGHLIAVEERVNFPKGVEYRRIYGENYKPGQGVFRAWSGGKAKRGPRVKGPGRGGRGR